MVASTGAGPQPTPYRSLTVEALASAIHHCLDPQTKLAAARVASKMKTESGVEAAVKSFHKHLPRETHCDVLPDQVAVWTYGKQGKSVKLSKKAAAALVQASIIDMRTLSP